MPPSLPVHLSIGSKPAMSMIDKKIYNTAAYDRKKQKSCYIIFLSTSLTPPPLTHILKPQEAIMSPIINKFNSKACMQTINNLRIPWFNFLIIFGHCCSRKNPKHFSWPSVNDGKNLRGIWGLTPSRVFFN